MSELVMELLIIDDHPLTCQGLASLLANSVAGAKVQVAYNSVEARAALVSEPKPKWIFLDINLPDDPQRSLFAELCTMAKARQTVLISAEADHSILRTALGCGVRGFIPKSADPAMVLEGFEAVRRGEVYLPPSLAGLLQPTVPEASSNKSLSPRLREVQALMLRGASNKVIARSFDISEYTVKEYVSSILAFHGVNNRLALILKVQGGGS